MGIEISAEGHAFDVFADQVRSSVVARPGIEERSDVGMTQPGQGLPLAQKALHGTRSDMTAENLERPGLLELLGLLGGEVDLSLAAGADQWSDPPASDRRRRRFRGRLQDVDLGRCRVRQDRMGRFDRVDEGANVVDDRGGIGLAHRLQECFSLLGGRVEHLVEAAVDELPARRRVSVPGHARARVR